MHHFLLKRSRARGSKITAIVAGIVMVSLVFPSQVFGQVMVPEAESGVTSTANDPAPLPVPASTATETTPDNAVSETADAAFPNQDSNQSLPLPGNTADTADSEPHPTEPISPADTASDPNGNGNPPPESPGDPPPYNAVQPEGSAKQVKPDVDLSSGALTYRYPFTLPPGRGGMTPDIALVYNSQNRRGDSPAGVGWDISIPSIDRRNVSGISDMFSQEYFVSSLSGELTRIASGSGANNFAARTDDGSFLRYTFANNAWTTKAKDGTTYFFGTASTSQLLVGGANPTIARWFLDRIEDKNNNRINFTYVRDLNQLYLDTVTYTDTASGSGPFSVVFVRELRPDADAEISYASGFGVETRYRVREIDVAIGGVISRKYVLGYTESVANGRSLLTSITQTGYTPSRAATTFPPTTFSYTTGSVGFTAASPNPFAVIDLRRGYLVTDVNGDGYADLVRSYKQITSQTTIEKGVWLNDHAGNFISDPPDPNWTPTVGEYFCIFEPSVSPLCDSQGAAIFDVNGDLLADYVKSEVGTAESRLNLGDRWEAAGTGPTVSSLRATYTYRPQVNEFDGGDVAEVQEVSVGGAFTTPPKQGNRTADVNHDGIADAIRSIGTIAQTNGLDEGIYLGTGVGGNFNQESSWLFVNGTDIGVNALAANAAFEHAEYRDSFLADFNGDELPDAYVNGLIYRYSGKSFSSAFNFSLTSAYHESQAADMNGDGLLDLIITECTNQYLGAGSCATTLYTNTGSAADLLQTIILPAGGTIGVAYKASSAYKDGSNNLFNPKLPLAIETVERLTETDPVAGVVGTTNYEYRDGRYVFNSMTDRRFGGFERVTATKPDGSKIVSYFDVTHAGKIGTLYRADILDAAGNSVARTLTNWTATPLSTLGESRFFSVPDTHLKISFGPGGVHRDRASVATYATSTGAFLQTLDYGEVSADAATSTPVFTDIGTDARTTSYTYATDGSGLEFLAVQTLTDYALATVSQSRRYYDNLPLGEVSVGNQTKEEQLIDPIAGTYAATTRTYTATGLVQTETDPLNHVTQFAYDTFDLYPATVTNAQNQQTTYTYDYSSGKPLTVTDPNGEVHTTVYDGFDRVTEEWKPDPASGTPVKVKMVSYVDQAGAMALTETLFPGSVTPPDASYAADLELDNGQFFSAPDSPSLSVTGDLTLEAWVKLESQPGPGAPYAIVSKWDWVGGNRSYLFSYANNGDRQLVISVSSNGSTGNGTVTVNQDIETGVWHHVAVVYAASAATATFYFDGLPVGTPQAGLPSPIFDSAAGLDIGASESGTTSFFDGVVDEVRVWNVARSQSQIFNSKLMQLGATANLQGLWHFNNSLADSSGNGNTLTNNHSATFVPDSPFGVDFAAPHTTSYLDGFARAVQTRTLAEGIAPDGTPSYTIFDTVYDGQGRIAQSSLPYAGYGSAFSGASGVPSLFAVYGYDASGRVVSVTEAVGTTLTAYSGWDSTTTDLNGHPKGFGKNAFGELVRVEEFLTSTSTPYTTMYDYDAAGNLKKITDAYGNIRNFTYDARGLRRTAQDLHAPSDATFGTYSFAYDVAANLIQKTTPKGDVINYTYDALNRQLTEDFLGSAGTEVTYTYDDACTHGIGRKCSEAKSGFNKTFSYDLAGNVAAETSAINGTPYTTSYAYNWLGAVMSATNPDNSITSYTFNAGNRIETVSWQQSAGATSTPIVTNVDYGPHGAAVTMLGGNGMEENFLYDSAHRYRLTEHTVGVPGSSGSQTNASIDLEKDASQFLTAPDSPSLSVTGDLTIETWAKFESDVPVGTTYSLVSKWLTSGHRSYAFGYDNQTGTPRLTLSISDQGGYNDSVSVPVTLIAGTWYHLAVTYQAGTGETKFYVNGIQSGYTQTHPRKSIYDSIASLEIGALDAGGFADGLMDEVRIWSAVRTEQQIAGNMWLEAGPTPGLQGLWHLNNSFVDSSGNGNTLTNNNNAVFSLDVPFGAGSPPSGEPPLSRQTYTYDAVGNILSSVEVGSGATTTSNYSYDGLDRLLEAAVQTEAVGTSTTQTISQYAYNAIGNITSATENGVVTSYSYAGSQGTSYANPHAATTIGSLSFTYDQNGNLLTRSDSISHTWDYNNRLTKITYPGLGGRFGAMSAGGGGLPTFNKYVTYGYDPSGTRIAAQPWGMATTTFPTKEFNTDGTKKTGHLFANGSDVGTIETATSTPAIFWNHGDHLRSTSLVTDVSGAISEDVRYAPFGKIVENTGAHREQRKFTSHEYDSHASTNYSYAEARYLDTTRGRFISEDPSFIYNPEKFLADPQQQNSYAYARNNPVRFVDPTGEDARDAVLFGAGLLNAIGSNFALGAGRQSLNELSFHRGQLAGDMISTGLGTLEMIGGAGAIAFGAGGCVATAGGGCGPGLAVAGLGVAAMEYGAEVMEVSTSNTIKETGYILSKAGGGSKNYNWGNPKTLQRHFNDHGTDFGSRSAKEYAKAARDFLQNKGQKGILGKIDDKGTIRLYDPKTNTFGAFDASGKTKTFFKPNPNVHGYDTNFDYWNAQPGTSL